MKSTTAPSGLFKWNGLAREAWLLLTVVLFGNLKADGPSRIQM